MIRDIDRQIPILKESIAKKGKVQISGLRDRVVKDQVQSKKKSKFKLKIFGRKEKTEHTGEDNIKNNVQTKIYTPLKMTLQDSLKIFSKKKKSKADLNTPKKQKPENDGNRTKKEKHSKT